MAVKAAYSASDGIPDLHQHVVSLDAIRQLLTLNVDMGRPIALDMWCDTLPTSMKTWIVARTGTCSGSV